MYWSWTDMYYNTIMNWNTHLIQLFLSFHAPSFCFLICSFFCFCFDGVVGLVAGSSVFPLTRAQDSLVSACRKLERQELSSHRVSKSFLWLTFQLHIHQQLFSFFSIWCRLLNSCYSLKFSNVKLCCTSVHMLIFQYMSSAVRYLLEQFCSFFLKIDL